MRRIESDLDIDRLSEEGRAERYSSAKTAHTIFNWWARRPFAAMRGVVAGALLTHEEDEREGLHGRRLLDLFSGGATIPLAAAQDGAEVHAIENNELAIFVNAALLRMSQADPALPRLVHDHGRRLLERLAQDTAELFPSRTENADSPIAYFWSRGVICPGCAGSLSLMKRAVLAQRSAARHAKLVYLRCQPSEPDRCYERLLCTEPDGLIGGSAWQGRAAMVCPFCSTRISGSRLKEALSEFTFDLTTAVCSLSPTGKQYRLAVPGDCPPDTQLEVCIQDDLSRLGSSLPDVELPEWSGITNPTLYGLSRISDLFNLRQRAVLVRLCRLLANEADECIQQHGLTTGTAVAAFLSGFIDQLVDWNSRLSMWIPQNEQVGRALSGPGIPMLWDFVEIDPVGKGPANLWDKLERIVSGVSTVGKFAIPASVVHADARALPYRNGYFDAIVTDPPYFDNLFYSVLADCVYVWKRLALRNVLPEYFQKEATDTTRELTAAKYRHGSVAAASDYFRSGISQALRESARVLAPGGVLALVFAHGSVEAWASVVDGLRDADLIVTAAWPLEVERVHRPRGMRAAAINTSFVLVARHRREDDTGTQSLLERSVVDHEPRLGNQAHSVDAAVQFAAALRSIASCSAVRGAGVATTAELLAKASEDIRLHDGRLALGGRDAAVGDEDAQAQLALL